MRSTIVKSRVRAGFDHGSRFYGDSAPFQDELGLQMVESLATLDHRGSVAIELGCGVGKLTRDVAGTGRYKTVVGLDISGGMLKETQGRLRETGAVASLVQADMESLPFRNGSADIVFSNLVFHWLPELAEGFRQVERTLKKDGVFLTNILAEKTFAEIREALDAAQARIGAKSDPSIFHPFPPLERILRSLESAGLAITQNLARDYTRVFPDPLSIMRSLKRQGVQNSRGLAEMGLGRRGVMKRFDEEYRARFTVPEGVRLTYQVIHLCAVRSR
ncbi:MAG: methyltransferase domain-containing protein [Nitrospinae bacterium]|nr:methyltransferase domain-containing protein [Nitrospinota bacterium]MBF0634952.1 methyltransferase domain-containing protein [Nitrospinota bacterium]